MGVFSPRPPKDIPLRPEQILITLTIEADDLDGSGKRVKWTSTELCDERSEEALEDAMTKLAARGIGEVVDE